MSIKYSTVKIVDNKVIFSQEIIDYFESLRNDKTSKWIDEYFKLLNDESNLYAEKYNIHHIKPVFTFKNEIYNNREKAKPLANKFNENLIKVSIYNHLFVHYYLWKIFDNKDSKTAFQRMCGQGKYIDNLTENELKKIARLKEDCTKKNQTEEEKKEHDKKRRHVNYIRDKDKIRKYLEENKERISKRSKEYNKKNEEKFKQWHKNYRKENREKLVKKNKEYRKENKDKVLKYHRNYSSQLSYDPIQEEFCTYSALKHRQQRNRELYKDVILAKCIIKHI